MKTTRLSLYYLATYLIGAGVALVALPGLTLTLLFSNGHYGDVMPRLLGVVLFALGVVVVQIIRHHVEALYTTTLAVRAVIVLVLAGLFIYSHDPLFISLIVVVGIGMILTGSSYLRDSSASKAALHPAEQNQ